jgi:hypothetical protein
MMNKLMHALACAGLIVLPQVAVAQAAAEPAAEPSSEQRAAQRAAVPDKEQLAKRLESVHTLLTTSSAARQIEASGNREALARKQEALAMHGKARKAFEAGNYAEASRLLTEAPKLLFAGARVAAPEQIVGDKKKRDYESRLASVRELLGAQKRIGEEKRTADFRQMSESVELLVARAEEIAKGGDYEEARQVLDQAYLYAKTAITEMREGDTLVRTLSFATKAEEYHYELDRNDTHQLLLKVLVEQQGRTLPEFSKKFLDTAAQLRREAEAAAARGDHGEGVRLLEEATGNLAKAIRSAGVFIPG